MFLTVLGEVLKGKSLLRTLMHLSLGRYSVQGRVLDVGSGTNNASYLKFISGSADAEIVEVDSKCTTCLNHPIDFEKDSLPYTDGSFDQVLMLNILEHIYNYNLLLSEVHRVLKNDGGVLGFVPFMINYHPDPHDFFRYTKEALEKIFAARGFKIIEIEPIGMGPFAVGYNALIGLKAPFILKAAVLPFYYFLDVILIKLQPNLKSRYPLGYIFSLKKDGQ